VGGQIVDFALYVGTNKRRLLIKCHCSLCIWRMINIGSSLSLTLQCLRGCSTLVDQSCRQAWQEGQGHGLSSYACFMEASERKECYNFQECDRAPCLPSSSPKSSLKLEIGCLSGRCSNLDTSLFNFSLFNDLRQVFNLSFKKKVLH
jgi:hypothetical protein